LIQKLLLLIAAILTSVGFGKTNLSDVTDTSSAFMSYLSVFVTVHLLLAYYVLIRNLFRIWVEMYWISVLKIHRSRFGQICVIVRPTHNSIDDKRRLVLLLPAENSRYALQLC